MKNCGTVTYLFSLQDVTCAGSKIHLHRQQGSKQVLITDLSHLILLELNMLCWMDKKSFISGDAPGKILLKILWRSSPSTFDRLITSSSDSLLNFNLNEILQITSRLDICTGLELDNRKKILFAFDLK
jgi:hypothetical protein